MKSKEDKKRVQQLPKPTTLHAATEATAGAARDDRAQQSPDQPLLDQFVDSRKLVGQPVAGYVPEELYRDQGAEIGDVVVDLKERREGTPLGGSRTLSEQEAKMLELLKRSGYTVAPVSLVNDYNAVRSYLSEQYPGCFSTKAVRLPHVVRWLLERKMSVAECALDDYVRKTFSHMPIGQKFDDLLKFVLTLLQLGPGLLRRD